MTFRMRFGNSLVIVIAVLVHALVALAKPPYYRVIELSAPNGRECYAVAISDAGHVVGDYLTDFVGDYGIRPYHAVLWYDGEAIDLGTLGAPDQECRAKSVNSVGQVVGWCGPPNGRRAFIWLPEPAFELPAGMSDLGTPIGLESRAYDINERGEVVGGMGPTVFLWLPESTLGMPAGLNNLCPDSRSCSQYVGSVLAINDLTQVVTSGGVWLPRPSYGRQQGWSPLPYACGVCNRFIADLNNSGLVAGTDSRFIAFDFPDLNYPWTIQLWTGLEAFFPVFGWTNGLNEQGVMVGNLLYDYQYGFPEFIEMEPDNNPVVSDLQGVLLLAPPFKYVSPEDINNLCEIAATISSPAGSTYAALLRPVNADVSGLAGTDGYEDLPRLVQCMSGPTSQVSNKSWCMKYDHDGDGNVDLADFFILQLDFDGNAGADWYWWP